MTPLAQAKFSPLKFPVTVRIQANESRINVFLNGKRYLTYTDPQPLPAGDFHVWMDGFGQGVYLDDVILKALPDLRCSPDSKVDGKDRICDGGLFDHQLWADLGPDDQTIAEVEFYLDAKFRVRDHAAPWRLDGFKGTTLPTGPHEIKAKVGYKDGTRATLISRFEVGERSLRCSPDLVLDGNDAACEDGYFYDPTWVYWWPTSGVKSVDYYLDGIFHRRDGTAPFELDGGAATGVYSRFGWDPSIIRAVVTFEDGRQPLTVDTTALFYASGYPSLLCSVDAVLDGYEVDCENLRINGNHEPFRAYVWPAEGISYVDYYLDGQFHRRDGTAPYELDGGGRTFLSRGDHDITAIVYFVDGSRPATAIRRVVSGP